MSFFCTIIFLQMLKKNKETLKSYLVLIREENDIFHDCFYPFMYKLRNSEV